MKRKYRFVLTTFLALLFVTSTFVHASEEKYNFSITEINFGRAMHDFVQITGIQLLYPHNLAQKAVNPVVGQYNVKEALKLLLKGSGFSSGLTKRGVIVITQKKKDREIRMSKRKLKKILLASASVLLMNEGGGAFAYEDEQRGFQLEEVVVTAQKRSALLQDVPIAVSAISGSQLEKLGASDFKDILRNIPGVSYSGAEHGQSKYNIRGVSTTSSSPTVGVYLDDVSLLSIATNFSGSADPIFFDFERLEVLKGPQGTLYGGNAMGGAIKYVSRKPIMDENEISVAGGLSTTKGGDISYEGQTIVNFGIVEDKLAIRAGILYRNLGGYIDQVADAPLTDWRYSQTTPPDAFAPSSRTTLATRNEKNHNDARMYVGRFSALWTPNEDLTIIPSVFIQRFEQDNTSSFMVNLLEFQASNRLQELSRDELDVFSLTVTKNFGEVDFTSLTGYTNRRVNFGRDYSYFVGSLVPPLFLGNSPNTSDSFTKNFTQEFRLASNYEDGPWQWVLGMFYSYQEDRLLQKVFTENAGIAFGTGTDLVYIGDTRTNTNEYAAFGEVTYSITEDLDFVAGLRFFGLQQEVDAEYDGIFNGGPTAVVGAQKTETGLNPKFSFVYRATEDNMAYATASKGFRQGGPNRFRFDPDLCREDLDRLGLDSSPESFDSDKIWSYELGSKNRLLDGSVMVNGSLFFTSWKNIQQTIELLGCGFNFTGNVGAAEIKGGELEVQVRMNEKLSFTSGLTYTDTKITETSDGVSARKGDNVLDVPKWMFSISSTYVVPLSSEWAMTLQADYQYHGANDRSFDELHTTILPDGSSLRVSNDAQIQDSYDVANAFILFSNDDWDYRFYVKNIFDSSPFLDFVLNDVTQATTLRPRTFGVNVSTKF